MQLWFARDRSVPIRDQLATQLMLAIASGELPAGKRLPSTRVLARRFRLHPNTVSAAYRQLEDLRWVESVRGSGVFVRAGQNETNDAQLDSLDRLILPFLRAARSGSTSAGAVRRRLDYWLGKQPRQFVFVHSDEGLRAIVCAELRQALQWQVIGCDAKLDAVSQYAEHSVLLTVPSRHAAVRLLTPAGSELVTLQVRQVDRMLARYLPVRSNVLTAIASVWPRFLAIARTILTAAGYDPEVVIFRDSNVDGWQRGLGSGSAVVCDVLTAAAVPDDVHKIVFSLVSDASISDLKTYEQFYGN